MRKVDWQRENEIEYLNSSKSNASTQLESTGYVRNPKCYALAARAALGYRLTLSQSSRHGH